MPTPNNGSAEYAQIKERLATIEDNLVVAAKLTERTSENVKDHAQLFKEFDARMIELAASDKVLEKRIATLVTATAESSLRSHAKLRPRPAPRRRTPTSTHIGLRRKRSGCEWAAEKHDEQARTPSVSALYKINQEI